MKLNFTEFYKTSFHSFSFIHSVSVLVIIQSFNFIQFHLVSVFIQFEFSVSVFIQFQFSVFSQFHQFHLVFIISVFIKFFPLILGDISRYLFTIGLGIQDFFRIAFEPSKCTPTCLFLEWLSVEIKPEICKVLESLF